MRRDDCHWQSLTQLSREVALHYDNTLLRYTVNFNMTINTVDFFSHFYSKHNIHFGGSNEYPQSML